MPTKSATPRKQPKQSKLNFKPAQATSTIHNGKKNSTSSNGNILNFFSKVEVEEQLFLSESSTVVPTQPRSPTFVKNEDIYGTENCAQNSSYEDSQKPFKRRKINHDDGNTLQAAGVEVSIKGEEEAINEDELVQVPVRPEPAKPRRARGPFLDDSDSEDDVAERTLKITLPTHPSSPTEKPGVSVPSAPNLPVDESCPDPDDGSNMQRYESCDGQFEDLEDLEGLFGNDYDDEFANDGEEYRERRFMEEQARLEAEEPGDYMAQACPICNATLDGITPDEATVHVNACLDGNPLPTPATTSSSPLGDGKVGAPQMSKRFAKAAVPRPGQVNPINLGSSTNNPTSAFSKLMSGHAEDSAWASAAAAEHASRGKPAYQRTCPFYKIMPGFFICVDAFRYGAVQGCNAYFLSHFHSDHYIGLTANWTHGPIYCSKVTGSLVKNQLRTASKYIKELKFEETIEVPGTGGVTVTMVPANHCPGSSLFLFEKKIGKGSNPRIQRILHCGDFRACPAHVAHPLLKPDLVDTISGKLKQQKIDICYLDTTYLNPRYSFPPQNDVIEACAEFCKALSGDPSTADEAFNGLKREKGSTTVNSFFTKENGDALSLTIKCSDSDSETRSDLKNRLLVICGTYSIGKERICKAIAQALNTKIFASPSKIKICSQLGDPELTALMTSNPYEAQVHMQMIMEIRAETLQDYLDSYKPHFTRIVGFRPSGWNFRSPTATAKNVPVNTSPGSVPTTSILHSDAWRTRFRSSDFVAQRGSTREAMCFGVPYSEHSSFRELALFLMTLRIEKVVPTVNIGSEVSRKRMKSWTDRWLSERRKGGIVKVLDDDEENLSEKRKQLIESKNNMEHGKPRLWDGKDGKGGGVYW
ncbi:DRMBL-domain-containing protein [Xylaria bambusicola]|uniref:DRMBL-domain-containing protein n=1 Tax=Xylaria bambusicola TaxID=326684 RepID=UPI002007FBAA|nr:DRMBL-domain-containing protein [Xylaria bambusicola]KAI0514788.1 DRMBL-domain-containing protein [Xylaria bambusicola]